MKTFKRQLRGLNKEFLLTTNENRDIFEFRVSIESVDELIALLKLARNQKEIKDDCEESGFNELYFNDVPIDVKLVIRKIDEFAGFVVDDFVFKTVQPSQTKKKG